MEDKVEVLCVNARLGAGKQFFDLINEGWRFVEVKGGNRGRILIKIEEGEHKKNICLAAGPFSSRHFLCWQGSLEEVRELWLKYYGSRLFSKVWNLLRAEWESGNSKVLKFADEDDVRDHLDWPKSVVFLTGKPQLWGMGYKVGSLLGGVVEIGRSKETEELRRAVINDRPFIRHEKRVGNIVLIRSKRVKMWVGCGPFELKGRNGDSYLVWGCPKPVFLSDWDFFHHNSICERARAVVYRRWRENPEQVIEFHRLEEVYKFLNWPDWQ